MHISRARPTYVAIWIAVAALITTLSLMRTGFAYGISNNVFHIPLVLGWERLSTFEGDAYYQSLHKFTSIVWPLLTLVTNDTNIETVFLTAHVLSRGLAMVAVLAFLTVQLRMRPTEVFLAAVAIALTPWLVGGSVIGGHGLWISYFTHSEMTWGFLLLALMAAYAQQWMWAAALAGLVFDINAFVGIWLVFMLGVAYCVQPPPQAWKQLLKSTGTFLVCSAPAIVWIVHSLDGAHIEFSFLEYVRAYFPDHFLIEATNWRQRAIFIVFFVLGFTATVLMPSPRYWFAVLAAAVVLFMVGAVLPYWLDHRLVFNLHLLRIGGVIQWLATLMAIIGFASSLTSIKSSNIPTYAMVGLLSLVMPEAEPTSLVVACASLAAIVWIERSPADNWLSMMLRQRAVVIGWIVLIITMEALRYGPSWTNSLRWIAMLAPIVGCRTQWSFWLWPLLAAAILVPQIENRGHLVRASLTPKPVLELAAWVRMAGIQGPILIEIDSGLDLLQTLTQQPVWVDKKQGAAVMWEPSFHSRWMSRYQDVRQLSGTLGTTQFLAYARQHNIRYIVTRGEHGACAEGSTQRYRNQAYLVCQVA